jgi:hypothetical protein
MMPRCGPPPSARAAVRPHTSVPSLPAGSRGGTLPRMGYHEAFWTLAGTTAPVIALAAVVSARQARDLIDRWTSELAYPDDDERRELHGKVYMKERFPKARRAVLIHTVNLVVQTLVLAATLLSLAFTTDLVPPVVAVVIVLLGMGLLIRGQSYASAAETSDQRGRRLQRYLRDV